MNKFRIGDTVRRVDTWDLSVGLRSGEVGIVSALLGNDRVRIKGYGGWLHNTKNLELVEQIDDELPPAPESVLYNDEYPDRTAYKQTWLRVYPDSLGTLITLQSGQYGNERAGVGMRISADAALQLAHDLRRMAMEIKRKEKQV